MSIFLPCSVRSSPAARVATLVAGLVGLAGWGMRDASAQSDERWQAARRRMVDEFIVREGVRNERVVQSMRTTPRHEFVPPAIREQAYHDGALERAGAGLQHGGGAVGAAEQEPGAHRHDRS